MVESEVKIAPIADSSWINLRYLSFFFLKKRNAIENDLAVNCIALNEIRK
jgi:hypothetical protein